MRHFRRGSKQIIYGGCALALMALSAQLFAGKGGNGGGGRPGDGGGTTDTNFAFAFEHLDKGLFLTTIDDGNRVQLTFPKGSDRHAIPSWSPDLDPDTPGYQGLIAYIAAGDGFKDLYVIDPLGGGPWLVRSSVDVELNAGETLAWTPNGREIVLEGGVRQRIDAIEVATGNLRVLIDNSGAVPAMTRAPVISAQGLLSYLDNGGVHLVGLVANESGLAEVDEESMITLPPVGFPRSFSPDETYLAFNSSSDNSGWQVEVLDLLTFDQTVVFQGGNGPGRVSWSPDGSQIATHGPTPASPQWSQDIYRITDWFDPANREVIRVTQTDGSRNHEKSVSWSPGWIAN